MDTLPPALEEKKYAICIYLDCSACFITLSRSIIYDKLDRYGIRGVNLDFIKVYFASRSQYECYDAVKSPISCQKLGVIQGSITDPLFFHI